MDIQDDDTPTKRIWSPVADLHQQHLAALRALQSAMTSGDLEGARKAHRKIHDIEEAQKEVHSAARQYVLQKLTGNT